MAHIEPFRGVRPRTDLARLVAAPPYDVLTSEEAREIAAGNPYSFLHVGKPEIDLPPGTDLYADAVYAKGKENFERFLREGTIAQDPTPRSSTSTSRSGASTSRSGSSPPRPARIISTTSSRSTS